MNFINLITNRYSVRDYIPQSIENDKLQAILEAGRLAPTACNNQPQRIFVASKPEHIAVLKKITPCIYNAPVVLVLAARKAQAWVNPFSKQDCAETDIAIVATHMMLQAADLGIGSTWVGFADFEQVKTQLNLPEDVTVYGLLDLGYPTEKGVPAPQHTDRKPLLETVTYL